jgi:hypothetical protein
LVQHHLANRSDFTAIPRKRTLLEAFLHKPAVSSQIKDEFDTYISLPATTAASFLANLFQWYFDNKETFPTLSQIALDTLSIPAMSVECERAFSGTKKMITSSRNRPQEDIVEATKCLKAWRGEDVTWQ